MDLENYSYRVSKIFEKLSTINVHESKQQAEGEKHDKIHNLIAQLTHFQSILESNQSTRNDRYQQLADKLTQIQQTHKTNVYNREKASLNFNEVLSRLQKSCKNAIASYGKEKLQSDKKFQDRVALMLKKSKIQFQQIIQIESEAIKQIVKYESQIPRLEEELRKQGSFRKQIEEKIYDQFLDQINDLKLMFDSEKTQREQQHEQILNRLKQIYTKVMEKIKREQVQREANEALLLQVVEQIVRKISSL